MIGRNDTICSLKTSRESKEEAISLCLNNDKESCNLNSEPLVLSLAGKKSILDCLHIVRFGIGRFGFKA